MQVLITDGNQRSTLAVTRSLGRRGIGVLVGEENKTSLASSSRYCSTHITYPSAYKDSRRFCHFLLEFLQRGSVDMVIPMTDVTTYLMTLEGKKFEQYAKFVTPSFDIFDFISNKWAVLKHAEEIGIPIPKTFFIEGTGELVEILDRLSYPVVVKAARSWVIRGNGWLRTSVNYAGSEQELLRLYRKDEYVRYPSLVQERVIGPGMGLFVLFNHGELVAVFSHKRLREKPPSGGVSVLRESIPVDASLKEYAVKLLQPLGWHGVAMMEYKLDQRTGRPVLIEVNGRFWGSLELAIKSGVDFPYLLYQLGIGSAVEVPRTYQIGVKSRWLLGDLDHLLLRLIKKEQHLNLTEGFPSRIKTLLQFMKFYETGLNDKILALKDPGPFLYEASHYFTNFYTREKAVNE
jgi:predicted ATP-grasp superfamily ATP-dependent carboligase